MALLSGFHRRGQPPRRRPGPLDPQHEGNDGKGLAKRAGSIASGVVNGALAVAVFQMVLGGSGGGAGARSWVAKLLAQPFGEIVLCVLGVAVILVGLAQFYKAYSKKSWRSCGRTP